jgi:hypothetical protein
MEGPSVNRRISAKPRHKREELADVAEFIRLVHSRLTDVVPLHDDGIWFSRRDDGSLFLNAEEARDYGLDKIFGAAERFCRRRTAACVVECGAQGGDLLAV